MIKGFVDSIWLSLAAALSAVVPALYGAFEALCEVKLNKGDLIGTVWNNLYVLLSVIILFAIAIKLVNAIVNPDVLTDKKKGVKKAFMNAVISIFLVVLLPFAFGYLREIQANILENDLIPKVIFNDDSTGDPAGEILWTAISSCINFSPMITEIDGVGDLLDTIGMEERNGVYMPSDPGSTSAYFFLLALSNLRPWVGIAAAIPGANVLIDAAEDTIFDFHPFILFVFLLVLCYELIIIVMDTALRAFKLLLLELMTPIVLGAYVFKSEILKNWAMEYIKTFLQVFLLIIALTFMQHLVPLVVTITDGMGVPFLYKGIIRLLLYIGVLRLVKQIGPLINKIFGTNIQGKGGIKGRLGEMAAVGALGQKAWGALGGFAKGVGTTALLGAGGIIGMNAKKKFDAAAKVDGSWAQKLNTKYGQLKNGKVGRAVRVAQAGVKSNGRGTKAAMEGAWNKDPLTAFENKRKANKAQEELNKKFNINETGDGVNYNDGTNIVGYTDGVGNRKTVDINNPWMKTTVDDIPGETKDEKNRRIRLNNIANKRSRNAYDKALIEKSGKEIERIKKEAKKLGIAEEVVDAMTERADKVSKQDDYAIASDAMKKFKGVFTQAYNSATDQSTKNNIDGLINAINAPGFTLTTDSAGKTITKSYDAMKAEIEKMIRDKGLTIGTNGSGDFESKSLDFAFKNLLQFDSKTAPSIDPVTGDLVYVTGRGDMDKLLKSEQDRITKLSGQIEEYKLNNPLEVMQIQSVMNALDLHAAQKAKSEADYAYFTSSDGAQSLYQAEEQVESNYANPPQPAPTPAPTPAPAPAPTPAPAPAPTSEQIDQNLGVTSAPTTEEHNERYQDLVEAYSKSGMVETNGYTTYGGGSGGSGGNIPPVPPSGGSGGNIPPIPPTGGSGEPGGNPPSGGSGGTTIINNYYNSSSDEEGTQQPKKAEKVEIDTSGINTAIGKMTDDITSAINEASRDQMNAANIQGQRVSKALESIKKDTEDSGNNGSDNK